jgi:hypothetical protein
MNRPGRYGFFPFAVAFFWLSVHVHAVDPLSDAKDKAKAQSAAEHIRIVFDQKISIDIAEQPLFLALNQLREQTKINFVFDRQTLQVMLQQQGQDVDALPVTVKLKDKKVSEVLKAIVKPYGLSYAIIGDSVFVSTDQMVMVRQLKQHISVDFDKVELATALGQLAKETATNIKLTDAAVKQGKTRVTLQMDDVPLETAVRLLAEMAGLKVVRDNNVLTVTTRANAADRRQDRADGIGGPLDDLPVIGGGRANWRKPRMGPGGGVVIFDNDVDAGPQGLPLTMPLAPNPTPQPEERMKDEG